MFILKFIFFVFLFFIILGLIGGFLLKRAIRRAARNINNMYGNTQEQKNTTRFSTGKENNKGNTVNPGDGEYVDFEEIR